MDKKNRGIKAFYLLDGEFCPVRILEFKNSKEAIGNTAVIAHVTMKMSKLFRRTPENIKLIEQYGKSDLRKRKEILAKLEKVSFENPKEKEEEI